MKIKIPDNFINERKYIISTIVTDFLGIKIDTEIHNSTDYLFILPNKKELIIKDHFFSKFDENEGYLFQKNIPQEISFEENRFTPEKDIPVIYGNGNIEIDENKIFCNIDLFASSFFMLTRWEEYVIKEKDKHNRFPDKLSLAYKHNFHKRAVVNEYTEMLWNMLFFLDNSLKRKNREYSVCITHDIDEIRRYISIKKFAKALGGDLLIRKNLFLFFQTIFDFFTYKLNLRKDPYDTFDFLMNVSEKHNLKSHFYFMPVKKYETDCQYDIDNPLVKKTVSKIIKRGHIVGVHFGYDSYNNYKIFQAEINRIKNIYPNITEGRQHYLRFKNPVTWQFWEDEQLQCDSTIAYSEFAGFRAGVCYEYNVFNILSRKKLKLTEKPLIVMDTGVKKEFKDIDKFVSEITGLSEITRKYNGNFVILWHNNNINTIEWREYSKYYETIINNISSK